jgi:peptidoglycan hydrolase-like amidase
MFLSRRAVLLGFASGLAGGLCACGAGERISLSSIPAPTIRVLLGEERESAVLTAADAWDGFSEDRAVWADRGSDLQTTITAGSGGIVVRGVATGSDRIRLRPTGAFTLDATGARTAYRGTLLVRRKGAKLTFVNELDLETYVAGVIVNEIGDGQAPSAYRAQSVVARSYANSRIKDAPGADFHVYDDERSQVYRGVSLPKQGVTPFVELAQRTAETRGVVLTWRSDPFPTYYFSTCGGHTTRASAAKLDAKGVTEPLYGVPCTYCTSSKYFRWTENVDIERLTAALKPWGVKAPITGIDWTKVAPGAWVEEVTLTFGASGAKKVLPGQDFRRAAGLRSLRIESATPTADGATLVVKGCS